MNKVGRRGRMNRAANVAGDKVIAKAGIQWCELNLPGCQGAYMLTRAHRKPRRDCDAAELEIFVYSCAACHASCDSQGHEKQFEIINNAIKRRDWQP